MTRTIGQAQRSSICLSRLPTPGRVHFDAEVVVLGMGGGDVGSGLAHAEADFEDFRGAAAEGRVEVEQALR